MNLKEIQNLINAEVSYLCAKLKRMHAISQYEECIKITGGIDALQNLQVKLLTLLDYYEKGEHV